MVDISDIQNYYNKTKDWIENNLDIPVDNNPQGTSMTLGYLGNDIPDEYLIKIEINRPAYVNMITGVKNSEMISRCKIKIIAPIQEDISLKFDSHWEKLSCLDVVNAKVDEVMQVVTGRALSTAWAHRRKWVSTSPLDFILNLKFQAVSNTSQEVVQPCKELQRMILPYSPREVDILSSVGLLVPPGPRFAPLADNNESILGGGEIINISIGKYLQIQKCIPIDVITKVPPRFASNGQPVGASISVHFRTFQIVTKNSLDAEVYGKPVISSNLLQDTDNTFISE